MINTDISPELKKRLNRFSIEYLSLIRNQYATINLTNIKNEDEFFLKQVIDSIYPFIEYQEIQSSLIEADFIVDVGFGGGFPILPLAILFPQKRFIGIEARSKKVKVVSEIANTLGINNVQFIHSRIEDVCLDLDSSLITFKAVGKAELFLSRLNVMSYDDRVVFLKGPSYEKDEAYYGDDHWDLEFCGDYGLEANDGEEQFSRMVLMFKPIEINLKKTKNKLVRLSELVEKF